MIIYSLPFIFPIHYSPETWTYTGCLMRKKKFRLLCTSCKSSRREKFISVSKCSHCVVLSCQYVHLFVHVKISGSQRFFTITNDLILLSDLSVVLYGMTRARNILYDKLHFMSYIVPHAWDLRAALVYLASGNHPEHKPTSLTFEAAVLLPFDKNVCCSYSTLRAWSNIYRTCRDILRAEMKLSCTH